MPGLTAHRPPPTSDRSARSIPEACGDGLRIAVVHEWIDAYAGSEQVFEAIAQALPSADLYALTRRPGVELQVDGRSIATTMLDRAALRDRRALSLPLMPAAWWALGRRRYDAVISSTHAFAHTNRLVRPGGVHLAYVHSPARYLWSPDIDRRGGSRYLGPAKALLRQVDARAARRIDSCVANSSAVAARVQRCWGLHAAVIHPPARVEFFAAHGLSPSRDYVLGVGRWVPYKHLDLVIRVGEEAGMPVKIAGRGPDRERLLSAARAAGTAVEIIESPTDERLRSLYAHAACLVFPTVDDFGIVPVEAQAAGTPVVSVRSGGVLDTVVDGVSGVLVDSLAPSALAAGVRRAGGLTSDACRASAERFSQEAFRARIRRWVQAETDPLLTARG